jgi:2-dehydro-3-deoxyphosphogluconate aldolase/(4S)-4-hydroxy-2-oxoglutarate aldolase
MVLASRNPIAIVRLDDLSEAVHLAQAFQRGGLTALEFTLTNMEALRAVEQVRAALGDQVTVGTGTVLDAEHARASIDAGAQFLVTPVLRRDVIEVGRERDVPVACGAFTPTEIWDAWQAGASMVKVFPIRSLGPNYLKDVLAPLPELKLVPTGGVNLENCAAYLNAGAYTVAIGSNLVDPKIIRAKDWDALADLARQYVEACRATT